MRRRRGRRRPHRTDARQPARPRRRAAWCWSSATRRPSASRARSRSTTSPCAPCRRSASPTTVIRDHRARLRLASTSAPPGSASSRWSRRTREYGFPRRNAFAQPKLEATCAQGLARFPNVDDAVRLGAATRSSSTTTASPLTLTSRGGREPHRARATTSSAATAPAAPSASISARRSSARPIEQRWLIVDLAADQGASCGTPAWSAIPSGPLHHPARPARHPPLRVHAVRRRGRDEAARAPDFVRGLLAAHGPDADAPIVRAAGLHLPRAHRRPLEHQAASSSPATPRICRRPSPARA